MGNKNGDKLFHGTKGNPQISLAQEEFAINNNGENKSIKENKNMPPSLENGIHYNMAQSKSVKKVDKINEISEHSVPIKRKPNSVTKKIVNGKLETERYYDENGNAYLDIDYTNHNNPKTHPVVPHEHVFEKKDGKITRSKWKEINK